jgi:hypothetical protein
MSIQVPKISNPFSKMVQDTAGNIAENSWDQMA